MLRKQRKEGTGQLREMHHQPECHRDPREDISKWNLKEVVWSEKKSKEASMAERNPERERTETGNGVETILNIRTSERTSASVLKGKGRHS